MTPIETSNSAQAGAPAAMLCQRAEELAPMLADQAAQADQVRQLPIPTVEALREAGMFSIFKPGEFGGFEADTGVLAPVAMTLARSCAATGWSVVIANGANLMISHFPDQAKDDVWGRDPQALAAGVFTPSGSATPTRGGYRVSGRWPNASGSAHATWGIGLVPMLDDRGDPVDAGLALMPMNELTIEDTWHTVGMRGTGSNTMVATDVFVPAHRIVPAQQILGGTLGEIDPSDSPMMRAYPVAALNAALAAPVVGTAQGALAYVRSRADNKGITYTRYESQSSSQAFVHNLGSAAMKITSAEHLLLHGAEIVASAAHDGRPITLDERRYVRGHIGHIVHEVCDAVNMLMTSQGASAFAEASPLARMWRDANTAARHAVYSPPVNYELYGGSLLEQEPISQSWL